MLRTIYRDPERFRQQYFGVYGDKIYYTGDGAYICDEMGNIRITGRVDDVMKVAGHRIANAEVENAIAQHPAVVECAVVPMPHDIKGEVPVAFVVLKPEHEPSSNLEIEIKKTVNKIIGPIARPERVFFVDDLPKTRSGKIMRRILRALLRNEPVGDITTLMNPEAVDKLKEKIGYKRP